MPQMPQPALPRAALPADHAHCRLAVPTAANLTAQKQAAKTPAAPAHRQTPVPAATPMPLPVRVRALKALAVLAAAPGRALARALRPALRLVSRNAPVPPAAVGAAAVLARALQQLVLDTATLLLAARAVVRGVHPRAAALTIPTKIVLA
jgi:hypothetical protein